MLFKTKITVSPPAEVRHQSTRPDIRQASVSKSPKKRYNKKAGKRSPRINIQKQLELGR